MAAAGVCASPPPTHSAPQPRPRGRGSHRHRVLRRSWADFRSRWGASLAASAAAANCSPCYTARFARRASSDLQSPRSPVVHPKGNPEEGNRSRLRWRNGRTPGFGNLLGWDLPAWKGSGTKSGGAEGLSPECSLKSPRSPSKDSQAWCPAMLGLTRPNSQAKRNKLNRVRKAYESVGRR